MWDPESLIDTSDCTGCGQLYPLTNQLLSLVPPLLVEKVTVLYIPHLQALRACINILGERPFDVSVVFKAVFTYKP